MATDDAALTFVIYGRGTCHLCDEMELSLMQLLRQVGDGRTFAIEFVDVDEDASLADRYGHRVPVLEVAGRVLCEYVLDAAAVRACLAEIR